MDIKKHVCISLPKELANHIEFIINNGQMGYKTKSEFVKEAVRKNLIELKKLKIHESQFNLK